jgi:hypothetical protein
MEWLSGDQAWNIQVRYHFLHLYYYSLVDMLQTQLGAGATVLGVILSSDKTNISVMTGGHLAHPLLISLANITIEYQNKNLNNTLKRPKIGSLYIPNIFAFY